MIYHILYITKKIHKSTSVGKSVHTVKTTYHSITVVMINEL